MNLFLLLCAWLSAFAPAQPVQNVYVARRSEGPILRIGTQTSAAVPNNPPDGFVLVKGGTFQMGDLFEEGVIDEKPVHEVTLSDFYMAPKEITFAEYAVFCKATGRDVRGAEPEWKWYPANRIGWHEALEFCNWCSKLVGLDTVYQIIKNERQLKNPNIIETPKWTVTCNWKANGYRLPTEAEWEYAAREGGRKVRFGNGKDIADPAEMNFDASAIQKEAYSVEGIYRDKTMPVGSFPPNKLGLYDLSGNVWEWCWDAHETAFYKRSETVNPKNSIPKDFRVIRGGSCYSSPKTCRAMYRGFEVSFEAFGGYNKLVGIRLVRSGV